MIVFILLFSALSYASINWEAEIRYPDKPKKNGSAIYTVSKDGLRMEMSSGDMNQTSLFNVKSQTFYTLDPKTKTYMSFQPNDKDRAKAKLALESLSSSQNQALQEALKRLPPEKRKLVEKQMQAQMGKPSKENKKRDIKMVASSQPCGKWTCDKYEVKVNGTVESHIWVAPTSIASGFGKAERDTMAQFTKTANPFGATPSDEEMEATLAKGFVVKSEQLRNGKISNEYNVKSINNDPKIDDSLFTVPSDYKEKKK